MRTIVCALVVALVGGGAASARAGQGTARRDATKLQGVLNLNQAAPDQLTLLPGIGPTKARRIVEYRTKHPSSASRSSRA